MHPTRLDLTTARTRLRVPPVTRFAPSPTGYLHLGHVVNAIYTWGVARALGGRVLLRIEDHDRIRSRSEFIDALLEDLEWLGFAADEGRDGREPQILDQHDPDACQDDGKGERQLHLHQPLAPR